MHWQCTQSHIPAKLKWVSIDLFLKVWLSSSWRQWAFAWGSMSFRTWLWTQCSWNMVGFSSQPTTKNWARSFLTALFPYSCINGDLLFKRSKEALRNSDPLRAHAVVIKVFPSDTTGRQSSISEQRFAYHDTSTCISLAQPRWDKQASLPDC